MVFDNGSCAEDGTSSSRKKKKAESNNLILAEKNMGKGGAWNIILAGAPGEIIHIQIV